MSMFTRLFLAVSSSCAPVFAESPDAGEAIPSEAEKIEHVFRYDASKLGRTPKSVVLAGSFNHFSRNNTPMQANGVIYTVTLSLTPGLYHYKFLVDETEWITDPAADKSLEDAADHNNSGVVIGMDARKLPQPAENAIETRGISHYPARVTDANIASPTMLRLKMRAQSKDVQTVNACFRTRGLAEWQRVELDRVGENMGRENFAGAVHPSGGEAEYFFELIDGKTTRYLADGHVFNTRAAAEARAYRSSMQPPFETPEWTHRAVWYQIFPERFRNGDPNNDPPNTKPWTSGWFQPLPGENANEPNFNAVLRARRYGGDVQGIQQSMPYLRSLGVTAIYLNPVFAGDSLHKYDTRDYRHIDDGFGVAGSASLLTSETDDPATWQWSTSDRVFLDFVAEAHRQGFKVIIDGVFNHVGRSHPFFQDVLKNGKNSRYADWFEIISWGTGGEPGTPDGIQYLSWNGKNGGMPLIKKDPKLGLAAGPREHILAITRRWLAPDGDPSKGVDGFRLDAADRVPHPFWTEFRKVVKSTKPDAYICGEIWGFSEPWLSGDQFDAVMNYQFAMACQSFCVDQKMANSPSQYAKRLLKCYFAYPLQVVLAQQNLLGSHDTDRWVSRFQNPDRRFDLKDDTGYKHGRPAPLDFKRAQQGVLMQMCFPGAPMVYYGDEAGMYSGDDPHDRMPMWWNDLGTFADSDYRFDDEHFAAYQRLIAIRQHLPELQTGTFKIAIADDKQRVFSWARQGMNGKSYLVVNQSPIEARIELAVESGGTWIDWMDSNQAEVVAASNDNPTSRPTVRAKLSRPQWRDENGKLSITLRAYGGAVISRGDR